MTIRPLHLEAYQKLIRVSLRKEPACIWFKNVDFLNVYTGKVERKNISISGERIAYVGEKEPFISDDTKVIELDQDQIIVPGYVEPHGHPFQLYHPITWSDFLLSGGTTTSINDNMPIFQPLGLDKSIKFIEELDVKSNLIHLWWARFDGQIDTVKNDKAFSMDSLGKWLHHPFVIQGGEFTSWSQFLKGDSTLSQLMHMARHQYDKRIEGHLPGASIETLNAMAAGGISADHESITGEDVLNRTSIGMHAALRHSSIRPDLPTILKDFEKMSPLHLSLLMLTSDGSHPYFLHNTGMDKMIEIVLEYGFNEIDAYRMATLNPVKYYGLDQDIGSITPGRLANLNVLEKLSKPTPIHVMVGGKWVKHNHTLLNESKSSDYNWLKNYFNNERKNLTITEADLSIDEGTTGVKLINDVISLPYSYKPTGPLSENELYMSLLDRDGKWIINTRIKHFSSDLAGLATSYNASGDYVLIGNDKKKMIQALQQVIALNGGIVASFANGDEITISLPINGTMSMLPLKELIKQSNDFVGKMKHSGYRFEDPFFTLFFLNSTHLPNIRLTSDGIYLIKEEKIITPVVKLER